ncbi:hypothetical protein BC831DRAFT_506012 [Entophlyctis helioformis]|nr:hypothetical protein BC831DRAFT_506012 [Entophlyctis helioformis]
MSANGTTTIQPPTNGTAGLAVIVLPDQSLTGLLLWVSILTVVAVIGLAVFEVIRRRENLSFVYYTRRKTSPSSTPPFPARPFEWIWTVFWTPSTYVRANIGLDAFMFLAYLRMSFQLFGLLAVLMFFVLIPVDYYASNPNMQPFNFTTQESIVEVATKTLNFFSIQHVIDGSNTLWVHVVCAYVASCLAYYCLFQYYRTYTHAIAGVLSGKHTGSGADKAQEIQFRSIMITNLPLGLRTETELRAWLQALNLGDIEQISMVADDDATILTLLKRRDRILLLLEKAYMAWAINLARELEKPTLWDRLLLRPYWRMSPDRITRLHTTRLQIPTNDIPPDVLERTRPIRTPKSAVKSVKTLMVREDAIRSYDRKLNDLTERIVWARTKVVATTAMVRETPLAFEFPATPSSVRLLGKTAAVASATLSSFPSRLGRGSGMYASDTEIFAAGVQRTQRMVPMSLPPRIAIPVEMSPTPTRLLPASAASGSGLVPPAGSDAHGRAVSTGQQSGSSVGGYSAADSIHSAGSGADRPILPVSRDHEPHASITVAVDSVPTAAGDASARPGGNKANTDDKDGSPFSADTHSAFGGSLGSGLNLNQLNMAFYKQFNATSCSAFVTFADRRSAYLAQQLSLHEHMDPYTMRVMSASAPKDVLWGSLAKSLMQTVIKRGLVDILCYTICLFWVAPTSFISGFSQLEVMGQKPEYHDFVVFVSRYPILYTLVSSVGPPLIIVSFNLLMPYLFDYLSHFQAFESITKAQQGTMAKYFFFLIFNVHFVFTLFAAAWSTSSSIFSNPLSWIEHIATAMPSGASFFINYLILNLVLIPVELLRPVGCIYNILGRLWLTTPREYYELNVMTSTLNYAFLYPIQILIFVVVICYSIISPLVLLPGVCYFACAWIVFKNQLLFVYVKQSEDYGRMWLMAYHRSVLGLGIFQFVTAGLLSAKKAPAAATVCGMLVIFTWLFYRICQASFDRHTNVAPLESLMSDTTNGADHRRIDIDDTEEMAGDPFDEHFNGIGSAFGSSRPVPLREKRQAPPAQTGNGWLSPGGRRASDGGGDHSDIDEEGSYLDEDSSGRSDKDTDEQSLEDVSITDGDGRRESMDESKDDDAVPTISFDGRKRSVSAGRAGARFSTASNSSISGGGGGGSGHRRSWTATGSAGDTGQATRQGRSSTGRGGQRSNAPASTGSAESPSGKADRLSRLKGRAVSTSRLNTSGRGQRVPLSVGIDDNMNSPLSPSKRARSLMMTPTTTPAAGITQTPTTAIGRSRDFASELGLSLLSVHRAVVTAEEHQQQSHSVSYMSPAYSKPLQEPWIPEYIAPLVREKRDTQVPEDTIARRRRLTKGALSLSTDSLV